MTLIRYYWRCWKRALFRSVYCQEAAYADIFTTRSPEWVALRDEFVLAFPACAVCGKDDEVEVHHRYPVHLFPQWELEWWNLITLCRPHHFLFGHLCDWRSYNAEVLWDCRDWDKKIRNRP